jgi:hypothetical protein
MKKLLEIFAGVLVWISLLAPAALFDLNFIAFIPLALCLPAGLIIYDKYIKYEK